MRHRVSSQAGFSLVEMLVATLILAFGLIGLAGLQATSLRANNSALQRSQVNLLAQDIVDRMRSNRAVAIAGGYDIALTDAAPTGSSLANTDVAQWRGDIAAALPSGSGAVACVTATAICTVTIRWDEARTGAGNLSYLMSTQL